MDAKEKFKDNVIVAMGRHLDASTLQILEHVLVKELQPLEIVRLETLPATQGDENLYLIELFQNTKGNKLAKSTVTQYVAQINNLIAFTGKSLLHINNIDVECYLNTYKQQGNCGEGNSTRTVNNARKYISAFFSWMRKKGIILVNPCDAIDAEEEIEKPIDHLSSEEMEIVRNSCKTKRDRALVEFLRSTAMRDGEVSAVKISDFEWNKDYSKATIYGQKGKAYRPVCLDSVARHYIMEYIKERGETPYSDAPLFVPLVGDKTKALTRGGIYSSIKQIHKRSGLQRRLYPHLFRKTTATNIIIRGGSDEIAGEYLGHKPQGVTGKHYTYKGDNHVIDIFKKYVAAV